MEKVIPRVLTLKGLEELEDGLVKLSCWDWKSSEKKRKVWESKKVCF